MVKKILSLLNTSSTDNWLMLAVLKWVYSKFIVKIEIIDKDRIPDYQVYKIFCSLDVDSNKGVFRFTFKEDRRGTYYDTINRDRISVSSYFVELIPPEGVVDVNSVFKDKIAVVVKIKMADVNYKALSSLLLDLYIDCFN